MNFYPNQPVLFTCTNAGSNLINNKAVVIRQLTKDEVDKEVGPMYKIRLDSGQLFDAFADELTED